MSYYTYTAAELIQEAIQEDSRYDNASTKNAVNHGLNLIGAKNLELVSVGYDGEGKPETFIFKD